MVLMMTWVHNTDFIAIVLVKLSLLAVRYLHDTQADRKDTERSERKGVAAVTRN
jgi:hypothetical protein